MASENRFLTTRGFQQAGVMTWLDITHSSSRALADVVLSNPTLKKQTEMVLPLTVY